MESPAYLSFPNLLPTVAMPGDLDDDVVAAADLLSGLNPAQREAVTYTGGPLLVVAGAGSGKTRVLTHRIAHILDSGRGRPGQILAITFTNKAAAEMRERVASLVGSQARRMWVFTFHSACVRILREQYQAAGLRSSFTIYDAADSQRLLTMVAKSLQIDTKRVSMKLLAARISDLKNDLMGPEQFAESAPSDPISQAVAQAYQLYQQRLQQAGALDFDDLIMRTVRLLREQPAVLEHYQRRFRHILVDEYQDTNYAQYALIRTLVGDGSNGVEPAELTVVGDSDQSIYAFRGATIRNIEEFEKDFDNAHTVVLDQNYRSTQNILSAANAVISRNPGRRAKALWTASGSGELISIDAAESEHDEARFVITEIEQLTRQGRQWSEIAIFYRTNSQSRALEEMLVRAGIRYRVVGGTKFYERMEIKDALAYLSVVSNPDDTVSLRRILNTPRRGIGAKAEGALLAAADGWGVSLGQVLQALWVKHGCPRGEGAGVELKDETWQAICQTAREEVAVGEGIEVAVTARSQNAMVNFWGLLASLQAQQAEGGTVGQILTSALEESSYIAALRQSSDPQDASRVENLAELQSVAEDFCNAHPEGELADFLEQVALVADADQVPTTDPNLPNADPAGQVTLMTVHTAKGLEFPVVFVTGLEDGTFPHQRSLGEESELAEERRLAYVAITRAREKLYLTRSAMRSAWGAPSELPPSRFLDDLPEELLDVRRAETSAQRLRREYYDDDDFAPAFGAGLRRNFGYGSPGGAAATGSRGYRSGVAGAAGSRSARRPEATASGGGKLGVGKPRKIGGAKSEATSSAIPEQLSGLRVGDRVQHVQYGTGTVTEISGTGSSVCATVDFGAGTPRRLLLRYAPMKKL